VVSPDEDSNVAAHKMSDIITPSFDAKMIEVAAEWLP
jgi:hypothetical protein